MFCVLSKFVCKLALPVNCQCSKPKLAADFVCYCFRHRRFASYILVSYALSSATNEDEQGFKILFLLLDLVNLLTANFYIVASFRLPFISITNITAINQFSKFIYTHLLNKTFSAWHRRLHSRFLRTWLGYK